MIGKTLGHYQITSHLGRGGMGEVYRGHDKKLNRDVALKFLPPEYAKDPARMGRFKREAQLLASLNHTNIAGIYGLEEGDSVTAIVMELAEGPTLAESISRKPIPLNETLSIAAQIAEALEAAHEKGIIHRDLKPANIKVTAEGVVKVLDFGLAKVLEGDAAEADGSKSPTLSMAATRAGIILGTAAYMAPEQARGSGVDRRCDIWSFGVVLFEILAGKRLFAGETISDTLAAILRADIDWDLLPKDVPATIRALLRRCLTRERRQRLQAIGEARIAIGDYLANPGELSEVSVEIPEYRFEITTPPTPVPMSFAISPDGRHLVFSGSTEGQQRLWLRPLDQVKAQPLLGTEGAALPFWSPDSRSIGFFAETKLKRIDIAGGLPQVVAGAILGAGGAWNPDGIIIYAPSALTPLYRVTSSGTDPAAATALEPPHQVSHAFPQFLPDGRHFLFSSWGRDPGIYLASLTYLGPVLWQNPKALIPKWIDELETGKPVVWIYPGKLRYGGCRRTPIDSEVVLQASIDALAKENVQVVLSTGHECLPRSYKPLPDNFRFEPFVPGLTMAGRSDLMIHHGGYGSCQTGLYAGVPQVIIPTFFERESNARRVAAQGAGEIVLPTSNASGEKKKVDVAELAAKVREVLTTPSYRENARRISAKLREYGGAPKAAQLIEEAVKSRAPAISA